MSLVTVTGVPPAALGHDLDPQGLAVLGLVLRVLEAALPALLQVLLKKALKLVALDVEVLERADHYWTTRNVRHPQEHEHCSICSRLWNRHWVPQAVQAAMNGPSCGTLLS